MEVIGKLSRHDISLKGFEGSNILSIFTILKKIQEKNKWMPVTFTKKIHTYAYPVKHCFDFNLFI